MHTPVGLAALAMSFITLGGVRPAPAPARVYCMRGPLSVETEWREDPLIVEGAVAGVSRVMGSDGLLDRTIYEVRVARTYRGRAASRIAVHSENDSGRFPMQRGQSYLLFLSRWEDGHYHVDNCGNSRTLARADEVIQRLRVLARQAGKP